MATFDSGRQAAGEELRTFLQRAVSCLSQAVVLRGRYRSENSDVWTLADRYVRLRGRFPLELSILHSYELRQDVARGRWKAKTRSYFYQVREQGGPELIAFHWHPDRQGLPEFAHLHIAGQDGTVQIAAKNHVPTGRVSLESFVRFLTVELEVTALRSDWEHVLTEGQRHFDERRTW